MKTWSTWAMQSMSTTLYDSPLFKAPRTSLQCMQYSVFISVCTHSSISINFKCLCINSYKIKTITYEEKTGNQTKHIVSEQINKTCNKHKHDKNCTEYILLLYQLHSTSCGIPLSFIRNVFSNAWHINTISCSHKYNVSKLHYNCITYQFKTKI